SWSFRRPECEYQVPVEHRRVRRRRQWGRTIHRGLDRGPHGGIAVAVPYAHARDLAARRLGHGHHTFQASARTLGAIPRTLHLVRHLRDPAIPHAARTHLVRALFGLQRLPKFRITLGLLARHLGFALLLRLAFGVRNALLFSRFLVGLALAFGIFAGLL